jgi:hypothetical protein
MQSSKRAYPITILLAKENTETYERYIRSIFQFTEKLRTEGLGEWLPFSVAEPQYMKSLQLCLTFCHLCQRAAVTVTFWTSVVLRVSCCHTGVTA